jgi:hypothetical protein
MDPLGGLPEQLAELRTPLAAVLVGVDEAAEPAQLLALLDRLAQQGARLLLVFRGPHRLAEQTEESLVRRPLRARWTRLRSDLDRIVDRLGPSLHERLGRVLPGPDPGTLELVARADEGLRRTVVLRRRVAGRPVPEPRRADELFVYEAAAERRTRRLERAAGVLDARIQRREELRGRVAGLWSLWRQKSGPPDLEAYRLYETAARLLRRTPCDVEEAEAAVERFVAYGPGRPSGGGDPGGGGAVGGAGGSPRSGDAAGPGRAARSGGAVGSHGSADAGGPGDGVPRTDGDVRGADDSPGAGGTTGPANLRGAGRPRGFGVLRRKGAS